MSLTTGPARSGWSLGSDRAGVPGPAWLTGKTALVIGALSGGGRGGQEFVG